MKSKMLRPRCWPLACFQVFIATILVSAETTLAQSAPPTLGSRGEDLLIARDLFKAGDKDTGKVIEKLIKAADKALSVGPFSVMNKKAVGPTGDKHDYMSLSPYWWPDPSKPDGKPYIRKDGEYNPERADYDLDALEKMSISVDDLSLAYFFTGDEKYAKKAADLVRAWCIDPATKMNPHLKFGQFVPGYDKSRPSGIIEGGRLRKVVEAVILLQGSPNWSKDNDAAVKSWFRALLTYITTSPQGLEELGQPNNHGTWAHVQTATYALFLNDKEMAHKLLDQPFKSLINSQISPDGSQPEEMTRTRSFHYHRFNTLALIEMASLGDRIGLDLWNYKTPDGRSLRVAIDHLVPYTTQEKAWPKKDIEAARYGDMIEILRRAGNAYREPSYERVVKTLQIKEPRELVDLLFPVK